MATDNKLYLDFDDDDPLKLVEAAYSLARDGQQVRQNQCSRDYRLYRGIFDASYRDPDRPNIFIPKIWHIVETKVARDTQVILGSRPWMPVEARRREFKRIAEFQTELLDEYADRGNFARSFITADRLKTLYGTAFIEPMPYFTLIKEKDPYTGQAHEVPRLRVRFTTFAPWEIFVDPKATGLGEGEQCRYIIKVAVIDEREVRRLYEAGAYGSQVGGEDLDPEQLRGINSSISSNADHWGFQMLNDIGLTEGSVNDGTCLLMRLETPDRYVDCLNGVHVIRDVPNPFSHKRVNLAKFEHRRDAHTQNSFWGIGEAKPNEVLQAMLNDSYNNLFENAELTNQQMMLYRDGNHIVGGVDALVRTAGNRIGIASNDDKPLDYYVQDMQVQPLSKDFYAIPEIIDRWADRTAQNFNMQTGETSQEEKTLGEAAMLREAGDSPMELNIRQIEYGLGDLASLCFHHIDQFGTMDDYVEVLGMEKAFEMQMANPMDLPGGFNFAFQGSDKVVNLMQKQRAWTNIAPLLMNSPVVKPVGFVKKTLELYNLDDADMDEVVMSEEEFAMQQQQQMMMQAQEQETKRSQELEDADSQHQRAMQMEQVKGQQSQKTSTEATAQDAGRQAAQI